jgi:hypothetical protein
MAEWSGYVEQPDKSIYKEASREELIERNSMQRTRIRELEKFVNWIIFDADSDDITEEALKIRKKHGWKHTDFKYKEEV